MDVGYNPAFNDSFGLEWFDLLTAFDEAGAVTFNTNRDLDMFKLGRVGIIIDGTWNINNLSQAIGSENLAINPWPTYGTGHLSGWVQSDSVYLNINSTGDDRFAALSFIGYLLDPNVQQVLAEVGHIPSVITTQPRDVLTQQAMVAFSNGIPYPIASDNRILTAYWDELDLAIQSVFDRGADPATVLQAASDAITQRLEDLRWVP
jgi:ABC-type glycerol-3-phosphate transport system substrate-binding protein